MMSVTKGELFVCTGCGIHVLLYCYDAQEVFACAVCKKKQIEAETILSEAMTQSLDTEDKTFGVCHELCLQFDSS